MDELPDPDPIDLVNRVPAPLVTIAWRKYLDSERGVQGMDIDSLGVKPSQRQFLENRLWWAFMSGFNAASDHSTEEPKT